MRSFGGPKCWIWRGAPEAVHLVWILIPQELDLALGAPGVFEEFWRSDFWIRRGATDTHTDADTKQIEWKLGQERVPGEAVGY